MNRLKERSAVFLSFKALPIREYSSLSLHRRGNCFKSNFTELQVYSPLASDTTNVSGV